MADSIIERAFLSTIAPEIMNLVGQVELACPDVVNTSTASETSSEISFSGPPAEDFYDNNSYCHQVTAAVNHSGSSKPWDVTTEVEPLLSLIQDHSVLYDITRRENRDEVYKLNAWKTIASGLGRPESGKSH